MHGAQLVTRQFPSTIYTQKLDVSIKTDRVIFCGSTGILTCPGKPHKQLQNSTMEGEKKDVSKTQS